MAKATVAGLISALASAALSVDHAYADGPFNFPPFSSSSPAPSPPKAAPEAPPPSDVETSKRVRNDNPRTTSAGFDPEALERGAKALREITSSSHAKKWILLHLVDGKIGEKGIDIKNGSSLIAPFVFQKVFEVTKKQEETRQAEFTAKSAEFKAMQAHAETAENEHQRARNQELVKMQEESSIRQEQARRATEEQIQAQRRQTEREKAEIERETIRVRAMAEAEGRAHEAKLAEDVNRRMLVERASAEREKWVAAINTTFDHIGAWLNGNPSIFSRGLRAILTDQNKLVVAVGGVTALAAGIYTTSLELISMPQTCFFSSCDEVFLWTILVALEVNVHQKKVQRMSTLLRGTEKGSSLTNGKGFGDVILHPSLQKRIEQLASATANTKSHQAPFRNMLFYGPPGTGKTMAARELAKKSGLDYALMTGGDVAPLGITGCDQDTPVVRLG
ncbi:ATPase family AAA domain-containing protein 3 [Vitis vinifera]|uniref:ATPase family AAA domain-containing protein 3 n=1 Tax=Vitis vinifera TaxID=29760 RepID=A0A438E259_VITVI|nr:ATPase family AAA domain-containing protein 3 [Vitis vinifera]